MPPLIDGTQFFGQEWAVRNYHDGLDGVVAKARFASNWRLQVGLFRSEAARPSNYAILYRNTQPNGSALLDIVGFPEGNSVSYSGEVRATGTYAAESFQQTVHVAFRGRNTTRVFGGTSSVSFGAAQIGVFTPVPQPTFNFGVRDRDHVQQFMPGMTYIGQLRNIGEFSVGLQKNFFIRNVGKLGGGTIKTSSSPWLYNATATAFASPRLAVYAGYTRGIEEFGTAPENTVNRGEPMPADITEQVDAGIRYRIGPAFNLMAGVFHVNKPYFDRDSLNVYAEVGTVTHRGVELSLTGKPIPSVTAVIGAVILKARLSGPQIAAGVLGAVPMATKPVLLKSSLQYDFSSLPGFAADAQVEYSSSQYANRVNTLRVPSVTTAAVGLRYATRINAVPTTFRAQITNLTNTEAWTVEGASGRFALLGPRRLLLRVSADF